MSETKYAKRKIGQHEMWYEPDTGFTFFVHVGTIDGAEAAEMNVQFAELSKSSGEPIFLLADDRKATGINGEARRMLLESEAVRNDFHVGLFGLSFALSAVIKLFSKALAVQGYNYVLNAVEDEVTARAWLTEQRRAYLARRAKA